MILKIWYFTENSTVRGTSSLSGFFPLFSSLSFKLLVNETQAILWSFTQLCRLRLHFLPHTLLSTNPQKQGKISLCHVVVLFCFLFFNDETNNRRKNHLTKLVSTLAKRWAAWLLPASLIKVSSLLFVYIYYFWRIPPPPFSAHVPSPIFKKSWFIVWFTTTLGGDRQL